MRLPLNVLLLPALVLAVLAPAYAQPAAPETPKVRFVVGGKSGVFYLPLTATERLGYFKAAGLDVEISDVQSGARALQSLIGGSADVGTGTFDHMIQVQAKGQEITAFVQYGLYPGLVLAVPTPKLAAYSSPKDLKGRKIGVTSPGSATHFMAAYLMVCNGLKADDASFIGTGVTSTAVAAVRRGELDAIVTSDPAISTMLADNLVKVVVDTRTGAGTQSVYGGPYPGGVVYARSTFIEQNPRTVQALSTAFVRALRWIASHPVEDLAKLMPAEFALGNPAIYAQALAMSRPTYSPDGRFVKGAAETAYAFLKVFDPAVASAKIDLSRTYTDRFVEQANASLR